MDSLPVSFDDVKSARALLEGVIRDTPVQGSRPLSERVGGPVWLKCENLQRAGSFKIRGAYTRISRLTAEESEHGVVAASAGNHGRAVAHVAAMRGLECRIFVPARAAAAASSPMRNSGR